MANDNTLGAPTEGLGQTVTFAAEGGRTPQMQPVLRQSMRNSSTGGGATRTTQALQVPEAKQDATFAALAKLGGDLLKPHLEAERTAMYMQGMQKAAQGQAITEIVDEQPWYSKLFGPTSLVDGARAYAASAKATALAVDFEQKLPEYRKLSANEFAGVATKAVLDTVTGDPTTDMMVQAEVSKTFPTMMKNQAKAHLRYQQEVFEGTIAGNADAAFAALGQQAAAARHPGSTTEDADVLGAGLRALAAFDKPAEMDQKHHDQLIANSAVGAIGNGNFAVFELLESSGKLGQMGADAQYQIRRAKDQASSRARVNLPIEFATHLADFKGLSSDPAATDASIVAAAQALNAKYTQTTGDSSPLIPISTTASELVQYRTAEAQRQAAARREIAATKGAADKALLKLDFAQRSAANAVREPSTLALLTPSEREDAFNEIRVSGKQNLMPVVVAAAGAGVVDHVTKVQIQANVSAALQTGDATKFHLAYTNWREIKVTAGDDPLPAHVYGGEYKDQLMKYDKAVQGRNLQPHELQAFFVEAMKPDPKPIADAKRRKAVTEALSNAWDNSLSYLHFTNEVPPVDPAGLATALSPYLDPNLEADQAVKVAKAQAEKLSIVGGYFWHKVAGTSSFGDWLLDPLKASVGSDGIHRATRDAIDATAKSVGITDGIKIVQAPDTPDKVPRIIVWGIGTDGNVKSATLSASDVDTQWKASKATYVPAKPDLSQPAPNVVYQDAEREAYRRRMNQ